MVTARRLYVYFVAAVSLVVLAIGLDNLLRLAFERLWSSAFGVALLQSGSDSTRQQLSLYGALVIVALPIWLVHWWLAQRATAERGTAIRALYLTLALALPLVFLLLQAERLIHRLLDDLLGPDRLEADQAIPSALAALVVAGAIWGYHLAVERGELRQEPAEVEAIWLPRLYLYLAALAGALLLLFGAASLLRLALQAVVGGDIVVSEPGWWHERLASGIAVVAVGLATWGAHWGYATRRLAGHNWWAESEHRSALRRLYLYTLLAIAVLATLIGLFQGLEALLRWALGADQGSQAEPLARRVLDPLLGALPFALFWIYQRRQVLLEAGALAEGPLQATARRLYNYLVALFGLALAAFGLQALLYTLLDLIFTGHRSLVAPAGWWRGEVSRDVALTAVGAAAWLWQWYVAERRVAREPVQERNATSRRAYLYLVVAGSLLALLGSVSYILYRVLNVILGARPLHGIVADLSNAIAIALVGGALLGYHLLVLRRDLRAQHTGPRLQRRTLVITAPPEVDLDAVLASLSAQLPQGVLLRTASGPGRPRLGTSESPRSDAPAIAKD